jgi:hypothetical protein
MRTLTSHSAIKSILAVGTMAGFMAVGAGRLMPAPQAAGPLPGDGAEPVRAESALARPQETALFVHEDQTRDALGFPVAAQRTGKHVVDGFQSAEYDEVSDFDASGRPISVSQFDVSGRLRAAVRLDVPQRNGAKVTREAATATARRAAQAAGLPAADPSSADADEATGGWTFHWTREQSGYRVRGDETRVQVREDGLIQSLGRVESVLAAAPANPLTLARARQIAVRNADKWVEGRTSGYSIDKLELQWVSPNGAFDPARIASKTQPCRLAWVANVKPSGPAAGYVRLIALFIDAGDGSVIGGDFVE